MSPKALLLVWIAGLAIGMTAKAWRFRGRPVEWKRRWQPRWYVALGAYMLVGAFWVTGRQSTMLFAVPAIATYVIVAVRATKFCDVCGAMCIMLNWRAAVHYCSRCGARLDLRAPGPPAAAHV